MSRKILAISSLCLGIVSASSQTAAQIQPRESRSQRITATSAPGTDAPPQTNINTISIVSQSQQTSPQISDSPTQPPFKVKDYGAVCNGIADDSAAIQSAILAASQTGGTIQFSGLCGVGAEGVEVTADNVWLKGSTNGSGIIVLAPGPSVGDAGSSSIRFIDCAHCGVNYLYVEVNGIETNGIAFQRTHDSGVWNSTIHAAGNLAAVIALGNRGNTYSDNLVHDGTSVSRGLWIGNTNADDLEENATISGNFVTRMKATGIVCTCTNSSITQNQSTNNGGSGIIFAAANQYRASHVTATGNTVAFNKFSGFQSDSSSSDTYSEFITISNNVVEENTSGGIYVVRARDWVVKGNQIRNNLISGVEVGEAKRINIADNLVEDTRNGSARRQVTGIHISAQATGANDVQDVEASNNVTRNNLVNGIFVVNSSPNTMSGVTISSNTSENNGQYGVRASAQAIGEISNVSIVNNSLSDNVFGRLRVDMITGQFDSNH